MNFNFELILFYATLITGLVALFDRLFLARRRLQLAQGKETKLPLLIDYSRSFFPILLIVFLLRSFLFEPFRIPSGSLEPTLLIGDFILVNKFDYGIRLPVLHKKIYDIHEPKRGDIIVFRWPPNPSYDFIKRVIGVPGDKINYVDKTIYINGEKIPQTFLANVTDETATDSLKEKQEDLLGVIHNIYQNPDKIAYNFKNITVPPHMYFVMGDNRDDSMDSRFWGFVPEDNIVGKASRVWMSWNSNEHTVRWKRLGGAV